MPERLLNEEEALFVLEMSEREALDRAITQGLLKSAESGKKGNKFRVIDLLLFELARIMVRTGVDEEKSRRYSEAVLSTRIPDNEKKLLEWVENEAQELLCLLEDGQLSRIFLRGLVDGKKVDVGAVKPVLFPTVRTEINVFRAIRPVVLRTRQLKGTGGSRQVHTPAKRSDGTL
ncbi:MAG: hypothetical protein AB1646_16160 [Thermodesulfobacteriota bacterium]